MARHAQHVRNGRRGKQVRQERAIERAQAKKKEEKNA
jgi:hypothetical protein